MAFATQNTNLEIFGQLKVLYGEWTGSTGDATGTVTVEGNRVYLASFTYQSGTSPVQQNVPVTVSVSDSVATLTVQSREAVTNGRFIIISS